jgi:hypothetical protein
VTVTSDGEACSGFLGGPGEPPTGSNKATIEPAPAGPIVIVNTNDPQQCQGTDLSQQTQTIYAGQQVNLRACLNSLQDGESVASATWTVNGRVIAFFGVSDFFIDSKTIFKTFTPPGDCVNQINTGSSGAASHSCTVDPFYWVCPVEDADVCIYPRNVTAVFEYTLDNGNGGKNTVTYNVLGPDNTSVPITVNPDGGTATVQITSDGGLRVGPTGITVISSDSSNGTVVGMVLMASAQLPQDPNTGKTVGKFSWARLFQNPSTRSFIQGSNRDSQTVPELGPGSFTCSFVDPFDPNGELVTSFPATAAKKNVPNDLLLIKNGIDLQPLQGEAGISFSEKDYLFWEPDAAGSDPTIPIPLGTVTFQVSGAATNSLDPTQGTQGWMLNAGCGTGPLASLEAKQQFPVWTHKQKLQSCGPQR